MAINFPSSPTLNQQYTYNQRTWQWNGTAWFQIRTGVAFVTSEVPSGSKDGVNTAFTTSAPFITGTLKVYLNGQRLNVTDDYTVGTSSFTMLAAPLATDILLVDYDTNGGEITVGATSFVTNEVPSGSVNGTNKIFTCARAFVPGSLQVFRDGQLMKGAGDDYTETTPTTGVFTFVTAPVSGSILLVSYQNAFSTAGNADTLDGYHASSFMQVSNKAANSIRGNPTASPASEIDIALAANQFLARGSTGNIAAKSITDAMLGFLATGNIVSIGMPGLGFSIPRGGSATIIGTFSGLAVVRGNNPGLGAFVDLVMVQAWGTSTKVASAQFSQYCGRTYSSVSGPFTLTLDNTGAAGNYDMYAFAIA